MAFDLRWGLAEAEEALLEAKERPKTEAEAESKNQHLSIGVLPENLS